MQCLPNYYNHSQNLDIINITTIWLKKNQIYFLNLILRQLSNFYFQAALPH